MTAPARPAAEGTAWPAEDRLPASGARAARFLVRLAAVLLSALAVQGLFNYLVDPFSMYGSPLELPRLRPVRLRKLALLRAAQPPPEALILGSSRVRMLPPAQAQRLFGLRTFHFGGPKASPQNWLSVTRYAVDELHQPIRLLIVGVDPGSFVDVTNYLHHPANVPELRRHLRRPALSWVRSRVHLWSPTLTATSLRVLRRGDAGRPTGPAWSADGFRRRHVPLDAAAITETSVRLHRERGRIQQEHVADFAALVDLAAARGIRILAFVTPETPSLRRALAPTHYADTKRATRELLREATADGLILCDVEYLGLGDDDFVDPHHPTPEAGVRILEALHRCAREAGLD